MNLRIFSALTVMIAVSGCGSITRGTTENVTITSSPSDASISTSIGKYCPRSPCTIEVNRRTEFTAYAEKDGYKKGSIEIKTKVVGAGAAGFAGNVLIGGVIGMVWTQRLERRWTIIPTLRISNWSRWESVLPIRRPNQKGGNTRARLNHPYSATLFSEHKPAALDRRACRAPRHTSPRSIVVARHSSGVQGRSSKLSAQRCVDPASREYAKGARP